MEQFSKDYFFKVIIDSLVSKAQADGKRGLFVLHRLVEPQAFGALKCFRFNIFYVESGNSILIDNWEFRMKVTEATYEEDIKPLYTRMLNTMYNFLESDKYKNLV